ncbi:MAG: Uma2 family endonuclease [Gemmatimonas sp.]|nr:Uma2 family endonuclease [Gemmatimonas sp.]
MAMPALEHRFWTAADVRELPDDGNRYECIDGALLVTPAPKPRHALAVEELRALLRGFVLRHGVGVLLGAPADVETTPGTTVQPDLFVARTRLARKLVEWSDIAGLELAIEVLSPSTARVDRVVKREFYQRAGVAEYWVVDLDARVIERWRPGDDEPEVVRGTLRWQPRTAAQALELDLAAFFAAVCD